MAHPSRFPFGLTLCLLSFPSLALGQGVTIDHAGVGCVVAGKFPRFDARLDPAAESGGSLTGPMTVTGVSSTTGIYQCAGPGVVFGPNPISDGTIAGTAVHWTFTFVYAQQSQTWSLDGVIAQDRRSMSGTWVWLDLAWEDSGTWTATRQ